MGESTDSSVSDSGEALSDESIEINLKEVDTIHNLKGFQEQAKQDYLSCTINIATTKSIWVAIH